VEWTTEWPTEPGVYWFYGWCVSYRRVPANFYCVEVWKEGNSIGYEACGHSLYKSEGAEGVWQPVQFPEPPEEQET